MARYFDVHPQDPQRRTIDQVVSLLSEDDLIVYPTDSTYAFGCRLGSATGPERIRRIRHLDARHDFTLVCADFAQLGHFVVVDNAAFRAIRAATPGPYTFILRATAEVPRRLANPKKKTVGVRIPANHVAQAIVRTLGEPIVSSSLVLPDLDEPLTDGWAIKEALDHQVDVVVDGGEAGGEPSTVVDLTEGYPQVLRVGAGDPAPFEA